MKKIIIIIMLLLFCNNTFAQSDFDKGFNAGFKAGFCYNKATCIAPPIAVPAPRSGEFNYQDGYNRGFQIGLDKQRGVQINSNNGYVGPQVTFVENAMYKLPYELIMEIIDKKEKEFEDKYGGYENREKIFKDLLIKKNNYI